MDKEELVNKLQYCRDLLAGVELWKEKIKEIMASNPFKEEPHKTPIYKVVIYPYFNSEIPLFSLSNEELLDVMQNKIDSTRSKLVLLENEWREKYNNANQ